MSLFVRYFYSISRFEQFVQPWPCLPVCTYHKPVLVVTSKRGRSFLSGKNLSSCFRRIIPFLKTKFKLLLCMLLVFCALRNISFNDDNHILKFFTKGFQNLLSSFFFSSENLLSSTEQCTLLHLYFLFGKFHPDICNKIPPPLPPSPIQSLF